MGLLCVQNAAEERPMMPSVVLMLSSEDTVMPEPKRPAFFMQSELSNEKNKCNSCTVTISEVQGR